MISMVRQRLRIRVEVSAIVLKNFYAGRVTHVQTRSDDGRSVRLPLMRLRPWFTHDGLAGWFELTLEGSRFVAIERLD